MEVGIITGCQVLSPKYDMDAYMATLFAVEQKARPNLQHKSLENIFYKKQSSYYFNVHKTHFNSFLSLKRWEFALMLGLGTHASRLLICICDVSRYTMYELLSLQPELHICATTNITRKVSVNMSTLVNNLN